jgi:uncharacterized protein YrrD
VQIKLGAKVYSSDDKQIGTVSYIVIYPGTKEVTHLVIQKGHLFTTDRVITVDSIYSADEKRVTLRQSTHDLEGIPEFDPGQYTPAEAGKPADEKVAAARNIPDGTVAVKEGAKVITSNGQNAGNVERFFTNRGEDRATNFLISKGLLLKAHKVIPTDLISTVQENEIRLAVDTDFLNSLPQTGPEEIKT